MRGYERKRLMWGSVNAELQGMSWVTEEKERSVNSEDKTEADT